MTTTISDVGDIDLDQKFVLVDGHERYPGQVMIQGLEPGIVFSEIPDLVSPYSVLRDLRFWDNARAELESRGFAVYVTEHAQSIIEHGTFDLDDIEVKGLEIRDSRGNLSALYPEQKWGLAKALSNFQSGLDYIFLNVCTGGGKTIMAVASACELLNRDEIDLCIVYTLKTVIPDVVRTFNQSTPYTAIEPKGDKRKRRKAYASDHEMLVMNYEKSRRSIDLAELRDVVRGKRVLFVFDEVQKITNHNLSRLGVDTLLSDAQRALVVPMTATVINGEPENYHEVFEWSQENPLGLLTDFRRDYLDHVERRRFKIKTKKGQRFTKENVTYHYDESKLQEVQHRVAQLTHVVRKTDPGVRERFKDMDFTPVPVQMNDLEQSIYDYIAELFEEDEEADPMTYYAALRIACLTPESHQYSENSVCQKVAEKFPKATYKDSSKLERVLDDIESIRSEGDKCVVFTHWKDMSLNLIAKGLTDRGIRYVQHHGGQSANENERAKSEFKTNEHVTVLLTSDAGSHGMNLQVARYVINFDVPYSFDLLTQRNDRIHRSDSYLDGLESRLYFSLNSVEERIWEINDHRRSIASATQGTVETHSRGQKALEEAHSVDLRSPSMKDLKELLARSE